MGTNFINDLLHILEKNKEKRICVLGTSCTGKSTLLSQYPIGLDMDDEIWPKMTEEEQEYVCQDPWTPEIGAKMTEIVETRLTIQPGVPLFGTVLLPCDLIVYLHISDSLLQERTRLRETNFRNAKNMQIEIEKEIKNSGIETITLEVLPTLDEMHTAKKGL